MDAELKERPPAVQLAAVRRLVTEWIGIDNEDTEIATADSGCYAEHAGPGWVRRTVHSTHLCATCTHEHTEATDAYNHTSSLFPLSLRHK